MNVKSVLRDYWEKYDKNIMRFKKKKNIIYLTICMVTAFILYQLYFFLAISSDSFNGHKIVPVLNHKEMKKAVRVRSEADRFINNHGVIKGVLRNRMVSFRADPNNEFKCLNSDQRIPFERVNDDFCDCDDGTDEPSTSACPNGIFYCDTQYQRKPPSYLTIPSGKVNDGICDCCDGSDEWVLEPNKKFLSQSSSIHYRFYVTLCGNHC